MALDDGNESSVVSVCRGLRMRQFGVTDQHRAIRHSASGCLWRGRVFAVRYFLTFMTSGIAVSMIAFLYGRGGFPLVLGTTAFVALAFLIAVVAIAYIAANVERDGVPHAMPAGVSGAGQIVRPALFSSSQTEEFRRVSASALTWIADCATPAPWRSARRRRTAY